MVCESKDNGRGRTIWITGLPNSGKTTLAILLASELKSLGRRVQVLDGDELRAWLSPGVGFSPQGREQHVLRAAHLARMLNDHGVWCLVAVIAPLRQMRQRAADILGSMHEVFLDCPVEMLAARDTKDLYRRALSGELPHFTGISDPYEPPSEPICHLRTDQEPADSCCRRLLQALRQNGVLQLPG